MEKGSVRPSETLAKKLSIPRNQGPFSALIRNLEARLSMADLVVREARLAHKNCQGLFVVESPPTGCENMLGPPNGHTHSRRVFSAWGISICVSLGYQGEPGNLADIGNSSCIGEARDQIR